MRAAPGRGNTFSQPRKPPPTHARAKRVVTTFPRKTFKKQSKPRSSARESGRRQAATPSGVVLLRICWKTVMISELCRNCSATRRVHDHDLYPRIQQTGHGRPQSIGLPTADKEAASLSELG